MPSLLKTTQVNEFVKMLKNAPVDLNVDKAAGTITAKEGEVDVFRAIQKGKGGPWLAIFRDGNQVKWK